MNHKQKLGHTFLGQALWYSASLLKSLRSHNMIKIAKLNFAHVHARGYARQIQENPETELIAVWDEEEYGGRR